MRKSKIVAVVVIAALGALGLLLSTLWKAYNPPPKITPTAKPRPEILIRVTQALQNAPRLYQKQVTPDGRITSSSTWQQGKFLSSLYESRENFQTIYWNKKLWNIDKSLKIGTVQSTSEGSFNRPLFDWPTSDFSTAKTEKDRFTFYSFSSDFQFEHTLKFDPETYLPRSLETVRIRALSPIPLSRVERWSINEVPPSPSPSPSPVATPVPVPTLLRTIFYEYPASLPEINPRAQFPNYAWTDYDQNQKDWVLRHSQPLLEVEMQNNKVKVLGAERNSWGDIYLFLSGNYPFGAGYKKTASQKIKVNTQITIEVGGIKTLYTRGDKVFNPPHSPFAAASIQVWKFGNLSLRKMPQSLDFRINFTSLDESGKLVENFSLAKAKWAPDFETTPALVAPADMFLAPDPNLPDVSRIALWREQVQLGNLPDAATLDKLDLLLNEVDTAPNIPPVVDSARWQLVQFNLKRKRLSVALAIAQKAHAKQVETFQRDPNYRVTVDWPQVLKRFGEL
ncbi:MAG: hypothetical protein QM758_05760 [Armatimonas sp.]